MSTIAHGGYDSLIECINPRLNKWRVIWNISTDEEGLSYTFETINHKPSLEEVKDIIFKWHDEQTQEKILSGFTWKDEVVWLSQENQLNYKTTYDLAVLTEGKTLPTYKIGDVYSPTYITFSSLEELTEFHQGWINHVSNTVAEGWKAKDSIDWDEYSSAL